MKKISTLLILAVLAIMPSRAQQMLATLNHNDSISVYYGMDALKSALNAAINGDIITLSSGMFATPGTITKAVTIRGAGAWTVEGQGNITLLNGDCELNVTDDSEHFLTLEGINFPHQVAISSLSRAQLWKCHFVEIKHTTNNIHNNLFYNCIIEYIDNYIHNDDHSSQFVNSVILLWGSYFEPASFVNCITEMTPNPDDMNKRVFTNCILYWSSNNTNPTPHPNNANTSFNSAFVNTGNGPANLFDIISGHNLWNFMGLDSVFKSFNGTYKTANFELIDSLATQLIGTDGTQIGIYGGAVPFDPKVTNPMIKRINVAQRSTADGKLAVDIEVVDDEEEEVDIIGSELN